MIKQVHQKPPSIFYIFYFQTCHLGEFNKLDAKKHYNFYTYVYISNSSCATLVIYKNNIYLFAFDHFV